MTGKRPAESQRPDALEEAKRIMKRLTEMPHKPHEPIGKRPNKTLAKRGVHSNSVKK
jgi:hypothetical protein